MLLKGQFDWCATVIGYSRSLEFGIVPLLEHLGRPWIIALFTSWKLRCKYVFSNEVNSINLFVTLTKKGMHAIVCQRLPLD